MIIEDIRKAIKNKCQIEYTIHCLERMFSRGISRSDVIDCIETGELIEDYPLDKFNTSEKSFPSCLILGIRISDSKRLHVVVGYNNDKILIISVYYPDLEHWLEDYKTRRI